MSKSLLHTTALATNKFLVNATVIAMLLSSQAYAGTRSGTPAPAPAPVPTPPPVSSLPGTIVTSASQVINDYLNALDAFEAAGIVLPDYWNSVQYSNNADPTIGQEAFGANVNGIGGILYADTQGQISMGMTNAQVSANFYHELGHAVTADMLDAIPSDCTAGSAAAACTVPEQEAENAADIIAASIDPKGPQDFVNNYFVPTTASDYTHGSVTDQFMAITNALPATTFTVPQVILTENGVTLNPGEKISVTGDTVNVTDSEGAPLIPYALETTLKSSATTDDTDDKGVDTDKSVLDSDPDSTDDPNTHGDGCVDGDDGSCNVNNPGDGDGDGDGDGGGDGGSDCDEGAFCGGAY